MLRNQAPPAHAGLITLNLKRELGIDRHTKVIASKYNYHSPPMQHCILQVFAQVYVHAVAAGLLHTFKHK